MAKLSKKREIEMCIEFAGGLDWEARRHEDFARVAITEEDRNWHSQVGQYKAAKAIAYRNLAEKIRGEIND